MWPLCACNDDLNVGSGWNVTGTGNKQLHIANKVQGSLVLYQVGNYSQDHSALNCLSPASNSLGREDVHNEESPLRG